MILLLLLLADELNHGLEELVHGFVEFAASKGWQATEFDILDALWLASLDPAGNLADEPEAPPPIPPYDDPNLKLTTPTERTSTPLVRPPGASSPKPVKRKRSDRVPVFPEAPGLQDGAAIGLPAPPSLTHRRELLQAFRPLLSRGPSRIRKRLDIDATIQHLADEQFLEIYETPESERQVELLLVLDYGSSMDVWRRTLEELNDTFRGSGAFRDVSVVCLVHRDGATRLVRPQDVALEQPPSVVINPGASGAPNLVLIVTDCASRAWQSEDWLQTLDRWLRRGAATVLQVLPEGLWPATALGVSDARLASAPAWMSVNAKWDIEPAELDVDPADGDDDPPRSRPLFSAASYLPVASLFELPSVHSLSEFLAGRAGVWRTCFRLQAFPNPAVVGKVEPEVALEAFRLRASSNARQLARLLAASPAIALPLARILQNEFMEDGGGGPRVLAEVWLAGLLQPLSQPGRDPEQTLYDFRGNLRQTLMTGVPKQQRQWIVERTSDYIQRNLGRLPGLRAMVANPAAYEGSLKLGRASDPIAWILKEILHQQGGLASKLIDEVDDPAPKDLRELATHFAYYDEQQAHRFAWSPDGNHLAVPRIDGQLYVRTFSPPKERLVRVSRQGLNQVVWSPDGSLLAVACYSRVVRIYDAERVKVREIVGHNSDVTAVAFSPDGALLATGTSFGTVRLWHTHDGSLVGAPYCQEPHSMIRGLCWLSSSVLAVANSKRVFIRAISRQEGQRALVANLAMLERLFFGEEASGSWIVHTPQAGVSSLAEIGEFEQDWLTEKSGNRVLAIGTADGRVELVDAEKPGEVLAELFLHPAAVTSLSVCGKLFLASKARDGSAAVVSLRDGSIVARREPDGSTTPYSHVAFRPKTHILAASELEDRQIRLFDLDALDERPARLRIQVIGSVPPRGRPAPLRGVLPGFRTGAGSTGTYARHLVRE